MRPLLLTKFLYCSDTCTHCEFFSHCDILPHDITGRLFRTPSVDLSRRFIYILFSLPVLVLYVVSENQSVMDKKSIDYNYAN
jgi:hypothetical protein